jgi:Arc/MetJ-type ribon-helix-helix transcriptional regulator
MTRVQILLPEEHDRRLEALAARTRRSKAELVRRALDLLFRSESVEHEPLLELVGQAGQSGRPDTSGKHDRALAAAEQARNRGR